MVTGLPLGSQKPFITAEAQPATPPSPAHNLPAAAAASGKIRPTYMAAMSPLPGVTNMSDDFPCLSTGSQLTDLGLNTYHLLD